jgi:hypothetical protein
MPEFLAREHVAQVHFDERHRHARKASRSAMLVCVNAPGLMMTKATPSRLAPELCAISSCSALLWAATSSCPWRCRTSSFDSISGSVACHKSPARGAEQIQVRAI